MATIEDFAKIELRVGRILEAEDVEKARKPIYKLTIDFGGEIGRRTILAGIKDRYSRDELAGKKIICIVNLEPKIIAGIESQGMVLAAEDSQSISLLTTDRDVKEGSIIR